MNTQGAYAGLRVLDLGQGVAAPYCAMLLAMHGAEVVKLEPLAGDWSRGLGMRYGDHTAMSAHYNRGKRSLALDLKAPAGREIASSLAARADIVIEGFRPGVAARLGLGYDELRARNPRLLYRLGQRLWPGRPLCRPALHRFRGAGLLRADVGQSRQ